MQRHPQPPSQCDWAAGAIQRFLAAVLFATAVLLAFFIGMTLLASTAEAQCVQSGATINCTGSPVSAVGRE